MVFDFYISSMPIFMRILKNPKTVNNFLFIYLIAYSSSYHEKSINALYELA